MCKSSTRIGLKQISFSLLVHYRIFAVTPNIEPIVRDDKTQPDTAISIEFQVLQIVKYSL